MDFSLTEEDLLLRKSVQNLVKRFESSQDKFRRMIFHEGRYPEEIWQGLAEMGVFGCLVPEEYGGSAAGLLPLTVAYEELSRHGLGNAVMVLTSMDTACLVRNASPEQKTRWLPRIAAGELKLCFATTEPDAGSNTFRNRTLARRDGDGYSISGEKTYITGADVADLMLLVCRTTPAEELAEQGRSKVWGLSLFLVDPKTEGIEIRPIPTRGIEGAGQFTVHLDNVHVPADQLIGTENEGAKALFNSLNPERILAAATALGMSEHLIQTAVDYARERCLFGDRTIASYQAIQHPLAEAKIQVEAARLLTYRAAWSFDQAHDPARIGMNANMAKFLAADTAIETCDHAIQTLGGNGFSEEYGIVYYWEAARLLKTAPISREMILNFVAEHVLDMPRSY